MPRFVILEHDHPTLHWDLMLEAGDVLQTWRLAQPPEGTTGQIAATALADHRLLYLDYEGPISGHRGSVRRWDKGTYVIENESTAEVLLTFNGSLLRGRAKLWQSEKEGWRFEVTP